MWYQYPAPPQNENEQRAYDEEHARRLALQGNTPTGPGELPVGWVAVMIPAAFVFRTFWGE